MSQWNDLTVVQAVLDASPCGILVADADGNVVWANQLIGDISLSLPELFGKTIAEIREPLRLADIQVGERVAFCTGEHEDNRWYECTRRDLDTGVRGKVVAYFFVDISEQHRLHEDNALLKKDLEFLSTRDSVTGLHNRRGLQQVLESQITRSRRYGNALSLIRMDISDFGTSDPAAVQGLIAAIGHALNDQLRWADMIGRWTENSFVLVLPETQGDAAELLARKLAETLGRVQSETDGKPYAIKARFAVTSWAKGEDANLLSTRLLALMEQAVNKAQEVVVG